MTKIKMIWAQDLNRGIGANGKMPWYLPEDYAHFKATTTRHPVIMGRTSWNALPAKFKPLPERDNYIITHHVDDVTGKQLKAEGGIPISFDDALKFAKLHAKTQDVFIIGGASIYEAFMPHADELIVTKIQAEFTADTYAPEIPDTFTLQRTERQPESKTGLNWAVEFYAHR